MNKQLKGFMDFVREQGVVGLAVGLAIGTQAGKAVEAIVTGLINPLVGYLIGGANLADRKWEVVSQATDSDRGLIIYWGGVLDGLLKLIAVAAVIYFVVRGLKLDKLDKKREK